MTNSNLDKLIAAEREKANKRIAKLRKQAADEQKRVDDKVVALLKEQKSELYARLVVEARAAREAEKSERSRKAKAAAVIGTGEPAAGEPVAVEHREEVM